MLRTVLILLLSVQASNSFSQYEAELSTDLLLPTGDDGFALISSNTQGVGVYTSETKRFNTIGYRVKFTVIKRILNNLAAGVQAGLTWRNNEEMWGYYHSYASVPLQLGGAFTVLKTGHSQIQLRAWAGLNFFRISNELASQQTGVIHSAELTYTMLFNGFFNSLILKSGYEYQVDNEHFFYRPSNASSFRNEVFKYKVKRHQVYFGLGILL